jgi:AbrB family looped-hinge helix DNA binding protein
MRLMAHNSYTAQIGARGRVVLPAELRERHGWKEGQELRFIEEDDGSVTVLTQDEALDRLMGIYAHLVPPGVSIIDEFIAERHAEAERE